MTRYDVQLRFRIPHHSNKDLWMVRNITLPFVPFAGLRYVWGNFSVTLGENTGIVWDGLRDRFIVYLATLGHYYKQISPEETAERVKKYQDAGWVLEENHDFA